MLMLAKSQQEKDQELPSRGAAGPQGRRARGQLQAAPLPPPRDPFRVHLHGLIKPLSEVPK